MAHRALLRRSGAIRAGFLQEPRIQCRSIHSDQPASQELAEEAAATRYDDMSSRRPFFPITPKVKARRALERIYQKASAIEGQEAGADVTTISMCPTPYVKTKNLGKTAAFIMEILNKEAVAEVKKEREIPELKPGYIVRLKVESLENKRRIQEYKGIIIAMRRNGIHTTFRLRRQVGGTFVENVLPLYSPLIKEFEILDVKRVRRAKLYYLREGKHKLKSIKMKKRPTPPASPRSPLKFDLPPLPESD